MVENVGAPVERHGTAPYIQALREHWGLIFALVVVAVSVAAAYSYTAEARYEAEADVLVTPISSSDDAFLGTGVLREGGVQTNTVLTAARLVKTPDVAEAVRRRLDSPLNRNALLGAIDVEPISQSSILAIVASADSATEASTIANAFAEALIELRTEEFQNDVNAAIGRLEDRLDVIRPFGEEGSTETSGEARAIEERLSQLRVLVGAQDPTLRIVSRAFPPSAAVWPRPTLSIAVSLLAALLLGMGAALALEFINPRVNREEELIQAHRLPILARVPRMRARVISRYLGGRDTLPADVWESYRMLRASLATAGPKGGFPRTVLVTSAIPGEGKTMTSVNLAITMAMAGVRVVLVDADLRRPMVGTVFGLPAGPNSFAQLLLDQSESEVRLVQAPGHGPDLKLLLASPEHAHLIDLLQRRRVERVLSQLERHADVVIIDSPPLAEVADALPLADAADIVLVTVRLGHSRRDKLTDLRRALGQRGITPAGFVVTTRARSRPHGYYYSEAPKVPSRRRARWAENGSPEPSEAQELERTS